MILLAVPVMIALVALGAGVLVAVAAPFIIVSLAYQVIMIANGGGWGMRIMGIRVVRAEDGANPGYGRAIARVLARGVLGAIPVVGTFVEVIDHLWMIWDGRKQTWHDKAARTVVIQA